MSEIITELVPTNLLEEKAKFFADPTYNPQLTYKREFMLAELNLWGKTKQGLVDHCVKMLKLHRTEPEAPFITVEAVQTQIDQFNLDYKLSHPVQTHFSEHEVTRCRVNGMNIYFQLPIRYTAEKFADLCRHELETHVLRRLNNEQQPWAKGIFTDLDFRLTEEGLANLHTHLLRANKILRKSYLTYLAVATAQAGSFVDVFNIMREQGVSKATAWNIALRTKRGITDTAQPGGLTKDLVYLEGTILVWRWLMNPDHNPKDLYLGRIGLQKIEEFKQSANLANLHYPLFIQDTNEYLRNIQAIGSVNHFDTLEWDYVTTT